MRKLNKEFGIKNTKKTSEENESVELTGSTDWDIAGNTDDGATTNEATLRTKDTSISSSTTMSHDRSTANKDLFATDTATTSTDQSRLHVSQKIDQNIYKKNKQKGTTTLLNSNNTDKVTDFTTVEPENTTAKFDKSEKFTASDDESNRNGQKFSNESVVATGQQLSSRFALFVDFFPILLCSDLQVDML